MENNDFESLDPFATGIEIVQCDNANPFYLSAEGSKYKYTKTKILAEDYKYLYILCLDNDTVMDENNMNRVKLFYDAETDQSELLKQTKLISLVRAPFSIVNINSIRNGLLSVAGSVLKNYNHHGYELAANELVFLMLETKEMYVTDWLKTYESEKNLDKFIQHKIFAGYYNIQDKNYQENLLDLLNRIADFRYWQDERNCHLSINNAFDDRKFNLKVMQKWKLPNEDIEKELQKLLQNFKEEGAKIKNPAYPPEITEKTKTVEEKICEDKTAENNIVNMNKYVDATKKDENSSFYEIVKPENLVIDQQEIHELLSGNALTEKERYYLICNLLVSKNYCHYVLNDVQIMKHNTEIFQKYKPVFNYLMGYAWISLYMEECIRKTRICESDRFVFDINTAAQLPVYPFMESEPHLNPYFCLLTSRKLANMTQNINGVKQTFDYQNGIVDLSEFQRRLNVFINGKSDTDILAGANWDHMAITGGCMAAIMPKTNPLMMLFKKNPDPKVDITDQELDRFYQEYYAKSDVDIACNFSNILDFIDHVKNLKSVISKNINVAESEIGIHPNKTLAIYINDKILKEKCDRGEIPFTYEYILNNRNRRRVKFYFYNLYLERKIKSNSSNEKILAEKLDHDEYFELIDYCKLKKSTIIVNNISFESNVDESKTPESNSGIEMVYYMTHENSESKESDIFIKFSENLRYKIISKHLKHPFEVFRISEKEYFSAVARFHLPCVRSYYNGKTCYLLPSAITAYHTLCNVDFKYFVGSNDPINIIDKYRKRGYTTVLNKMEIQQYLSYIMASDVHRQAYFIKDTNDIKKVLGAMDITNEYFQPRKNIPSEFIPDPNITMDYCTPKVEYINTVNDITKHYKHKYPKYCNELFNKTCIDNNGAVTPFKRWFIDAGYDYFN